MSQEQLFSGLKKYFNFDNFKSDIQRKAIECVLKGNNSKKSILKFFHSHGG